MPLKQTISFADMMKNKNGLSNTTTFGRGGRADNSIMRTIAVAPAAVVPFSSTSITALWWIPSTKGPLSLCENRIRMKG